ncbi:DNA-protecting protein DprA [Trinickia violacea]|uniref:DNA-protecting protein DprA n=1 Tax=Trinickia violacea TaxID=2571746 RepID=A0A4P8IWK6_9BURK|nr:DNA-processing protein DprA [Trinickia violacea]QCP51883.1 DNA-protecting protein DprA [Trinickia violacea]
MQILPMTDSELAAWLRLATARGLAPVALRALLDAFGLPEAVLATPFRALAAIVGDAVAHAVLAEPPAGFAQQLAHITHWRAQPGNAIVTLGDPAYPPALLTMPDPPPLLYVKGRMELLHATSVAIVGSRNATPQGLEDATRFAQALSDAGLSVVSGLAQGIDGAAHRGALAGRGSTIAVIGTGADIVYPAIHHALAHQIAAEGVMLSEWPLGTPARSAHFPQRNRLIAGLSSGVLIVEAALRSGSLITARLANEMGRDVFAIPGSIHAPLSRGCHRIIKDGAKLVETVEEVLEELGIRVAAKSALPAASPGARPKRRTTAATPGEQLTLAPTATQSALPPPLDAHAERLLAALGHAPATFDVLAARTEMENATLQSTLLQLELAGRLTALPGGRFARIERG